MAKEPTKIDLIIDSINKLSDAEKRELTIAVRTTTEGNKAYVSFLYGVTSVASSPVVEVPTEEPCETTENSTDNNSENNNNEWL